MSDIRWQEDALAAEAEEGLLSRGDFIRAAALAGAALTAAGPLAERAVAAQRPKRGGRLRCAHVGGGNSESFNPGRGSNFIDASRYFNVYDPLVRVRSNLTSAPGLALEWIPNKNSTQWLVKLRRGVEFHNGKDFTADDVIYTLRSMGDKKHVANSAVSGIRLGDLRKQGKYALRIPLKAPNARLFDNFNVQNSVIIPVGLKDFSKPIGTGAFAFQSFTPGQRSLCVRNANYWDDGKPYVDEWEDISIDDPAARLNALLAGEVDMISQLDPRQARAQLSRKQIQVLQAPSPSIQVFTMAVDTPPFNDKRVRQAFRLIADRKALIDGALAGFGTPGNDLAGLNLPFFWDAPTRKRDPERAKALLKAAGQEDLSVTLQTSNVVPGFVEAATLFAQQAKAAGVDVKVKRESANAYFDTSLIYTKMTFAQSFWTVTALGQWYTQSLASDAVWNETHWRSPSFDKLLSSAIGAPDAATAKRRWRQVQQIQYDEGGYIVWANVSLVDGLAKNVRGVRPSSFFNLNGWNYRDAWLA
ncbi:MAG: ABC transporter substrate-binding protein [Gaiella sp.]